MARYACTILLASLAACGGRSADDFVPVDASDIADAATHPDADDAPSIPDAPADVDLLAPCAVARDVYHVEVGGPQGVFQLGAQTVTNLGATWTVSLSPDLYILIDQGNGPGGSVTVYASPSGLVPGVYPQGGGGPAPWLELAVGDELCGIVSGTFTLTELNTTPNDGGDPDVASLAMTFDLLCQGATTIRGCVRYAQ